MGYLDDALEYLRQKPGGLLNDIPYPWDVARNVGKSLLASPEPRPGYDATTAPPRLQGLYSDLQPDPNADYGRMPWAPFARDRTTGETRWAMPSSVRQGLLGGLDLLAGTETGAVTPRALDTLNTGSALVGGTLSAPGALGAGGARRAPFRVPQVARADLDVAPAGIGHNMPPVTTPAYLDAEGNAIKGAAYSKASKAALDQVKEAGVGAGPLDLSGNQRIPGILQEDIPRYDPNGPRRHGVSQAMQDALVSNDVRQGVLDSIDAGTKMGAGKWYHNKALYDAFVQELGPDEGHKQFQKYMDYQSAASPRSDVPTNIRNASFYYVNQGRIPGPQVGGEPGLDFVDLRSNPYPYGHVGQKLHRQNADKMAADQGDWGGYDPLENPKPPSYGTNLGGNLQPVAADTHAFRNIVMRTRDPRFLATQIDETSPRNPFAEDVDTSKMTPDEIADLSKARRYGELVMGKDGKPMVKDGNYKIRYRPQKLYDQGKLTMDDAVNQPTMWRSDPNDNEYKAVEDFYAELGRQRGLTPAEAQSAAWAGGGGLTGLGTPSNRTFGQMHNERLLYTSIMRGENPKETLRALIRRERPLLTTPGGGMPAGLLSGGDQSQSEVTPMSERSY
jgi:hypothetical protein